MSTVHDYITEPYTEHPSGRTTSTSIASRASSNRSSSSQGSDDSLDRSRRSSNPQSPKPRHQKSGSFGRLFGTKEPSLDSFKKLAELQQKELDKKGQKLPFGVPQAKLPSSVKDDYKKAKQRAKERAKMHEAIKEKMKLQEDEDRQHNHTRKCSSSSLIVDDEYLHPPRTPMQFPASPRTISSKRFSALGTLPEVSGTDRRASSTRLSTPSPPSSYEYNRAGAPTRSVLAGSSRREALPWEHSP